MAIIRNIPIRQDPSFMKYTQKGYPPSKKKPEWDTYFNCQAEASRSPEDFVIASLEDSLQKANEML